MSIDELTELYAAEERRRPRRLFIAIFTLLVLVAVILLLVMSQGEDAPLAQLRIRDADVDVRTRGTEFKEGVEGQALSFEDAVRTDVNGQAQVDYFDGSLTRLDSDTTFVIRELRDAPEGKRISVRQDAGRTWNRVERLASTQDRYELHGVTAVATVRGTTFVWDSRQAPIEYALGVSGTTLITLPGVGTSRLQKDDCLRIEEGRIRPCTKHEEETLKDDWYFTNFYYDGGDAEKTPIPETPPATPFAGSSVRRTGSGSGAGVGSATTPAPDRTPRPPRSIENHDKEETHDDPDPPSAEPPTDPPPTDTDEEEPPPQPPSDSSSA